MKDEIRAGPFIPTVKITEYFTLLSQLSLPPPVVAPVRWKRRRDEADLLHDSLALSLFLFLALVQVRERRKTPSAHRARGTHGSPPTPYLRLALSFPAVSAPSSDTRLQIYAPRLAALISESSRPVPSVMKEINLLFWGRPRDRETRRFVCAHGRAAPHPDDVGNRRIANLEILPLDLTLTRRFADSAYHGL